jgi:hypothetical protein
MIKNLSLILMNVFGEMDNLSLPLRRSRELSQGRVTSTPSIGYSQIPKIVSKGSRGYYKLG